MLGHGAGGGVTAPDLVTAAEVAAAAGVSVALIEQPYRVAGRKSAAPAHHLDAAWLGGRGRAARRGAGAVRRPLLGRAGGLPDRGRHGRDRRALPRLPAASARARPEKTRLGELEAVEVPVLIVQGESDPFGMPPEAPAREVVRLRGDHGLKSDRPGLRAAVAELA